MPVINDQSDVTYLHASGFDLRNAAFLGHRNPRHLGYFQLGVSESWVIVAKRDDLTRRSEYRFPSSRWLTGVWCSPLGTLFVTDAAGEVHVGSLSSPSFHSSIELGASLDGIWGIDDHFVLAWGTTSNQRFSLFRFDGHAWSEVPGPGFDVRAIHGTEPHHLCAVGPRGAIAHFDGHTWRRASSPVDQALRSVFVAGPDEFYATGVNGALLQGSSHGWQKIAQSPAPEELPLHCVAKWKGNLWLAAGPWGLLKRIGKSHRLETVTEDFRPIWFDARGDLLITCKDVVVSTSGGRAFEEIGRNELFHRRRGRGFLDFRPSP